MKGSKNINKLLCFLVSILLTACIEVSLSFSIPNNSNNGNNNDISSSRKNPLTAAQRARREEEQRRIERTGENIPGKTSAIPGAKDFELNVERTENEWLQQASGIDRQVREYTSRGMDMLRMLRLEEAKAAFDHVYQVKPYAYCWQAGVVKFYLGDLHGAAECFAHNAHIYESRFGQIASEERIWRDACELKIANRMNTKKWKQTDSSSPTIAQIRDKNDDMMLGPKETRKVIRIARDLFSSSLDNDLSNEAIARAKLRSICGEYDANNQVSARADKKMWRLNSWYYLGLHYDVLGDASASRDCMKMALRQCASSGNSDDIIQTLPMLHMAKRDWFDDDDFVEDTGKFEISEASRDGGAITGDSMVLQSIQESLDKMKLAELQRSLKKRGLKSSGSKSVLKDRLLRSLLDDAGLN
mmetsp:Transcript_31918/g.37204  ORF Transcript_31918/g.37204 Transcript_31918/m.37204 type:complete len:415 (-) Transcript_31918:95-1339(-)